MVHKGTKGGKNNCANNVMSKQCNRSIRQVVNKGHEKRTFGFLYPAEEVM